MNKLSTPKAPESPHLAARREWNERYGDYIKREAAWRTLAVGSLIVTGIAVAGLVFNKLGFEPAPLVLGFVLGPPSSTVTVASS